MVLTNYFFFDILNTKRIRFFLCLPNSQVGWEAEKRMGCKSPHETVL